MYKSFKTILKFNSGYKQVICNKCKNIIAIPVNRLNKNKIWCLYCGNTEKEL